MRLTAEKLQHIRDMLRESGQPREKSSSLVRLLQHTSKVVSAAKEDLPQECPMSSVVRRHGEWGCGALWLGRWFLLKQHGRNKGYELTPRCCGGSMHMLFQFSAIG